MIAAALLTESHDLISSIAPELVADRPLYVLRNPADVAPARCKAFATVLSYELREALKGIGAWRGRGGFIVFQDHHSPDREAVLATAVHEAAHLLPAISCSSLQDDRDPAPAELERWHKAHAAWAAEPELPGADPWQGHGPAWIRRVIHLWSRALFQGVALPTSQVSFAGGTYGLSPDFRYIEALWPELYRMRRWRFAEIEAEKPPCPFIELFAADVAAWNSRHPKRKAGAA